MTQKQTEQKVKSKLTVNLIFIVGLMLVLSSSVVLLIDKAKIFCKRFKSRVQQEAQVLISNQDNSNQSINSSSNSSLETKGKSEQLNSEYMEHNQPSTQLMKGGGNV